MGKNLLIKITMGKPPNEMGNCPFASPWLRHWFPQVQLNLNKSLFSSFSYQLSQ